MPNDSETRKYIAKCVEDLHSLVVHGLQPVSQQVAQSRGRDHTEAAGLVIELERTLNEHERRLSSRLDDLGTSPTTTVQDAAAGMLASSPVSTTMSALKQSPNRYATTTPS